MNNDLISREALRNVILNDRKLDGANANWEVNRILVHIDNAPTVKAFTEEDMTGAYNEGYMCGNKEAEKGRPQGEWIYLNEDEPMTVECPFCHERKCCISNYCDNCGARMQKGGAE